MLSKEELSTVNEPKKMNNINDNFSIVQLKRTDLLKIIAIITMLIDHIGAVFFPQYQFFRIIGRLAFPIFAFHIAIGYIHTSNLQNYIFRLLIFAFISQIPYGALFGAGLNIFFTLLVGLICIYGLDKEKYFILAIGLVSPMVLPINYGYYGIFTIMSFYVFKENTRNAFFAHILLNIIYFFHYNYSIQIFSLAAMFLIYRQWDIEIRLNKYLYYAFYPIHILGMYLLNILL